MKVSDDQSTRVFFLESVYMRKLALVQVSYQEDFLILYRIYVMMNHFLSCLFEGSLHVDKIHMRFKIVNIMHYATRSSPPAEFCSGVKFSHWYNNQSD